MQVTIFGLGEAGSLIAADLAEAGAVVNGFDPSGVATPEGVPFADVALMATVPGNGLATPALASLFRAAESRYSGRPTLGSD